MRPSLKLLLAAMVFFWSANYIVGKVALREFPPLLLGTLRIIFAGAAMWPIYLWERHRNSGRRSWERRDIPFLIVLGVLGVTLNQLFFVSGLSRTSVAHSSIIIAMTPIFVLIVAVMLRQELMTPRKIVGMALALAGIFILNLFPAAPGHTSAPTLTGDCLTALAGMVFALFTVFGKPIALRHSSITVNAFAYIGGAFTLLPLGVWMSANFSYAQVSLAGWMSLIYMALFPSVICYLIYYHALGSISASRVAALSYLQPVVATAMGVPLLGEPVAAPLVAGGAIIFLGVYLAERD